MNFSIAGLAGFLIEAYLLGHRHGEDQLDLDESLRVDRVLLADESPVHSGARDVQNAIEKQVKAVAEILAGANSSEDLDTAVAATQRIEKVAETGIIAAVHETVANGTQQVARSNRSKLVWLAERDACLHCLAYSGHIQTNGTFSQQPKPQFAPKPLKPWRQPLPGPPRHPHCRCQLVAWNGVDSEGPGDSFPDALKREARRSVVKGFALPSESATARQKAAALLLARGAGLPVTVEERARKLLKKGKFKTRVAP